MFFWFAKCFKQYADFQSRAGRSEYWYFTLVNFIIVVALEVMLGLSGAFSGSLSNGASTQMSPGLMILALLFGGYCLGVFIPGLAVSVRRLHDTNHSGWWLLIGLVPLVGAIILLVFKVTDSDVGDNQYGPRPPSRVLLEAANLH